MEKTLIENKCKERGLNNSFNSFNSSN